MFVMGKVDGNRYLSIAKLINEAFDEMDSRATAPRIYAMVLSKEADFAIGDSVIPQPQDGTPLDAGDLAYRTYAATKYHGSIYLATSDFFGVGSTSVPSIYWAIIDPSPALCTPSLLDWGVVASEQGLSLAFPAMAAREECGAFLAYAYGGNTTVLLDGNSYPAYAGVAASVVGCKSIRSGVDIVKRGEGLITRYPEDGIQRWGDYSALDVFDGVAWFAVPVARNKEPQYGSWIFAEGL